MENNVRDGLKNVVVELDCPCVKLEMVYSGCIFWKNDSKFLKLAEAFVAVWNKQSYLDENVISIKFIKIIEENNINLLECPQNVVEKLISC